MKAALTRRDLQQALDALAPGALGAHGAFRVPPREQPAQRRESARGYPPHQRPCLPEQPFRETPLYNDYYRAIGIDHAMAMPIYVDRRLLVSFVFNRARRPFNDRDLDPAEIVRPQLAQLYRLGGAVARDSATLTPREREVLEWLAAGKTNRDIAEIIGAKPRTVEKHLERVYEKLGVETRTAAVMRAYQS